MVKQTDLRILKTNDAIKHAFLKLIKAKGFSNTTINDIANAAKINRSTFYLHFTDKYDLLNHLVSSCLTNIIDTLSPEFYFSGNVLNETAFRHDLAQSLEVIAKSPELYSFVFEDPESLGLRQQAEDKLQHHLQLCLPQKTLVERDLILVIVPSIYIATLRWWLSHDMKYSSNFLADELVTFFKFGSKSVLDSGSL
ncbi:TetR/AcrR family transcriptional regulator [Lactobacillus rhamnosus]|uniref:TetR/AcrR family transcriptional regulator n=1 Tax=Lacticaseibacillus rhamnosus TaxID=47715 RepID=A0A7Y7QD93_LACRH|nr:TetR/AcrR family transcriptional regulator [Lacticaseibacillus rhamnosus]NVO86974.1 TetR/AcrR family transcriptional regulator [Lacticaseibacillus rhamnosus]